MPPRKRLDWTREEVILAMDLYVNSGAFGGGRVPGPRAQETIQLSDLLKALGAYPAEVWPENYRNPDGVHLKLMNLRAVETDGTHGMPAFSQLDAAVWREYVDNLNTLQAEAEAIRQRLQDGMIQPAQTVSVMKDVPLEKQNTETYITNPDSIPQPAVRAEQKLVLRYHDYMQTKGIAVIRKKYVPAGEVRPIYSDAWVAERNLLIEAKNSDSRDLIRQAIGQLYDYRRFHPEPPHLAVLVPYKPSPDRLELLNSAGIHAIWPHGEGFTDSAHRAYV